MGVEDILARIKEEGRKEIGKIESHCRERIAQINLEQEKERKFFYDAELLKIQKEAEELKRGILLSAKLEKRKKILKAKRNEILSVLNLIKFNFKDYIGGKVYLEFLKNKIESLAQDGDTVVLNAEDLNSLKDFFQNQGSKKLKFLVGNFPLGMIIQKKEYNYNLTLDSLISSKLEELENRIGKELNVL